MTRVAEVNLVDNDDGCKEELAEVVEDVDQFLKLWIGRLRSTLEQCRTIIDRESELQKQIDEFEGTRRRWNQQRQDEIEEIHQQAEQLREAWQRLEEEQRVILQQRGNGHHQPMVSEPVNMNRENSKTQVEIGRSDAVERANNSSISGASMSRDMAVQEFYQLRRELGFQS